MSNEALYFTSAVGFEAARKVTLLPEGHRSRREHGHSFVAKVRADATSNPGFPSGSEVSALQERLALAVKPLDYQNLNNLLDQPTDENLARWIGGKIDLPGIKSIGLQSTVDEGVDLDADNRVHVWRRYRFEAAHRLPNVPPGHKCGRMHGHGFEVILHSYQDLRTGSIGIDFDHLDAVWHPIQMQFNHMCLNDIEGLENPTSELIASWIWRQLKPALPELSWVTVYETASCGANFDGEHFRIWKEMTLDSSLQLKRAPSGDPRRQIHGHTYVLRLHLQAPLDKVFGWAVDFGDVKDLFNPIFKRIDHQPLHEIPGLEDCDTASLARWIKSQSENILPQLDRIDLYETRGCGTILSWAEDGPALPI